MEMCKHNCLTTECTDLSALGLLGLGIVTLAAASQKLGFTEGLSLLVPWAVFLGCFAQLAAAISDTKRNNFFGATAFGAFSLFWISIAFCWLIQSGFLGEALKSAVDKRQLGFVYLGFLIFTVFMTIASTQVNKQTFILFLLVDVLLIGLSFSAFGILADGMHKMAGLSELAISLVGFYGCGAVILNKQFEREMLPLGKPYNTAKPLCHSERRVAKSKDLMSLKQ